MNSERVGIFCRLAGSGFQTDGLMKLNKRLPKDFKVRFGIFKNFQLEDQSMRDMCRAMPKGKIDVLSK